VLFRSADRIARTETMWATNEGMRQQYMSTGIDFVDISPAPDACDECMDMVASNPYQAADAEGLLPIHPNCRCVLVGDYSQFGLSKSVKKNFKKDWVTINGRHINIGDGGGDRGGGNAGSVANVPGVSYKRSENLVSHEGAPDKQRVQDYKQLMKQGHPVSPVLVTKEGDKWGVVDGQHRFEAYKQSGTSFIPTVEREGMGEDATVAYDRATQADNQAILRLKN